MMSWGLGYFSLSLLVLLLIWLRATRCLSLVGSALAGAVLVSSVIDFLWTWGSDQRWYALLLPVALVAAMIALLSREKLVPSRRWVAFGIVCLFVVRLIVIVPTHTAWSGRVTGQVRDWLVMSGLDPSSLPKADEAPPPSLSEIEMPCGLSRFRVRSSDLKPILSSTLRIEPCGLSPQAFVAKELGSFEISNSLAMAVEIAFAVQEEGGKYSPTWSVVVPPQSSVEVPDFKVPVGGAVLVYAPLEPHLGIAIGSDLRIAGEFWVSRTPLMLRRQAIDTP